MNGEVPVHSEEGLRLIRDVFARGGFGQGIGRTLGLVGMSADPGAVVLAGDPSEDHQNPLGTVHGGYVATLLDGAMALALQTCLDPGTYYATTDLNINYLRGVKLNAGAVRAEGRVIDLGRSRALAEARLTGSDGQLHAFATGSFSVRR
ncbi:MAG: thioesterase [Parvibaculum sp.]|nr:thioesterase [Parvibaculum sp.]